MKTMMNWRALESDWCPELEEYALDVLDGHREERVPDMSFQEFCELEGVSVRELARLQNNKIDYLCMSLFKPLTRYTTSVSNRHAGLKRDMDRLQVLEEAYSDAVKSGIVGKKLVKKPLVLNTNADRAYVRVRYRRELMRKGVPQTTDV